MNSEIVLEICADSIRSAQAAETGGADRIELCSALSEGGVTPSYGQIKCVVEKLSIPVNVLVRPRGGDFLYSEDEFDSMKADIEFCKSAGAAGVVLGILNADGTVDGKRTGALINLAYPLSVTFHRAIDVTRDPLEALNKIIELGAVRVLTSGSAVTAEAGIENIGKLVSESRNRITIMAGGGINENNVRKILSAGVKEIHCSAREKFLSGMIYKNETVRMSGNASAQEYYNYFTSAEKVASILKEIKNF